METFVYTGLEKENKKANLKNIKLVWSKSLAYPFQVLKQVLKDKPQIVHIQHEINMFGDWPTALIFPLLPFLLKMTRVKVVVTIHAIVSQKQIDIKFLETFWRSEKKFFVPLMKIFFYLLFKIIKSFLEKRRNNFLPCKFPSHQDSCHSKKILCKFQHYVSYKSITYNDIHLVAHYIAAFNIAYEIKPAIFK